MPKLSFFYNTRYKYIRTTFDTLLKMITSVKIRVLQLATLSILISGLLGCGKLSHSGVNIFQSSNVDVTNIGDIQKNRDAYSTVYLKGKVTSVALFVGSGAYELQDATGSIWVITTQTLPAKGDEVLIKSLVQYKSIPIGGKDLGEVYVQEQEQMERQSGQKK